MLHGFCVVIELLISPLGATVFTNDGRICCAVVYYTMGLLSLAKFGPKQGRGWVEGQQTWKFSKYHGILAVFQPELATVYTDSEKFGMVQYTTGPLPHAKIGRDRGRGYRSSQTWQFDIYGSFLGVWVGDDIYQLGFPSRFPSMSFPSLSRPCTYPSFPSFSSLFLSFPSLPFPTPPLSSPSLSLLSPTLFIQQWGYTHAASTAVAWRCLGFLVEIVIVNVVT